MGQLFSLLSSKEYLAVDLNFEGTSKPEPADEKVYSAVAEVLAKAPEQLKRIEDYKGCQELARKAMSKPTLENEQEAFEGLLGAVDCIASFFNYCKALEKIFQELLKNLDIKIGNKEKDKDLDVPDALTFQLAQIFDFALEFDRVRMLRPNLSNDFSYYRRLLPKFNKHPSVRIKDDEASGMALFTAEHIPMTNCLNKAAARAQENGAATGMILAIMANSCCSALKNKKFANNPKLTFCCSRAMAASIVIYDQIEATSVFHKRSPIQVKQCILLLKKDFAKDVSLLNAIHYSTKHFNEAPQSIQDLFD